MIKQSGFGIAVALAATVALAGAPSSAYARDNGAAIGLGIVGGAVAGAAIAGAAANPYYAPGYYPNGYYPAPAYYPPAPYYPAPRSCWNSYYRNYYQC